MKRIMVVVVMLSTWGGTVYAQQPRPPLRVGTHVAGNMMNGPFDLYRVGGHVVIPVAPRLALYPSISRFLDGAEWELSFALRYRPFGSREGSSPFYTGVGVAGVNWGMRSTGYDLWITGLELPSGRLRPYAELQFLGPVHRFLNSSADWGVQAYTGLTWAVR